jgi:epimerase transport system membrane fusion protein
MSRPGIARLATMARDWLLPAAGPHDSEEAEEMRRWALFGIVAVLVAATLVTIWAVWAPLHGAVLGHGMLKVEGSRQVVQHQEGGLVKGILVRNGSRVKKGDVLVALEDLRVDASVDILAQQLYSEMAKNVRLSAEREMRSELDFPQELLKQKHIPAIGEAVGKERNIFAQRRTSLQHQLSIIQEQIVEAEHEATATLQQIEADVKAVKLMAEELAANDDLLKKGFISNTRMLALRRSLNDYEAKLGEHRADNSRARQKKNDLRLRTETLRSEYRDTAARELKDSTDRLNEYRQRAVPLRDVSLRQNVTAPTDGVVVDLKLHTIGATVAPREPLMDIVPDNQRLIVEAKLPQEAISELHTGMPAEIRLTAFKQRVTPMVKGELTYLSADVLSEPGPGGAASYHYLCQITLDPASVKEAGIGQLQPGMPAEVYIQTRPRSAIQYLLDPVTDSLNKAFRER